MNAGWANALFYANLVAHAALILGAVWCIAFPERRMYPRQTKGPWYYAMWLLFDFIFASNLLFVVVDWNSGPWTSWPRFIVGVPLVALGVALLIWGVATVGTKNTSGLRDGFVARGPYLITRNPQYLGDFFVFAGVAIIANSEVVMVTHFLTSLVFLLAPFAEEPWLKDQYGVSYLEYRREIPRFL